MYGRQAAAKNEGTFVSTRLCCEGIRTMHLPYASFKQCHTPLCVSVSLCSRAGGSNRTRTRTRTLSTLTLPVSCGVGEGKLGGVLLHVRAKRLFLRVRRRRNRLRQRLGATSWVGVGELGRDSRERVGH